MSHEVVGELTHEGIGGDAAEPVAAAAFQSYAQFAQRTFLALVFAGNGIEFTQNPHAFLHLVAFHLLGHHQSDAGGVVVAEHLHEVIGLVVLTPKSHHQHTTGIGVEHDVAEHLAGVLMVLAQLRAAIVVVPGMHGVDALASGLCLEGGSQAFGDAVHASHSRHYPYLVADAHLAVLAHISVEGLALMGYCQRLVHGMVFVGQRAREVGLQVVLVHPFSGLQVMHGMSDRIAVFDDVVASGGVSDEHFVTHRCVLPQGNDGAIDVDLFALGEITQAHHHTVGGVDFNKRRLIHDSIVVVVFISSCVGRSPRSPC